MGLWCTECCPNRAEISNIQTQFHLRLHSWIQYSFHGSNSYKTYSCSTAIHRDNLYRFSPKWVTTYGTYGQKLFYAGNVSIITEPIFIQLYVVGNFFFLSRIPIANFMKYHKVSFSDTRPQAGRRKTDERTTSLQKLLLFLFLKPLNAKRRQLYLKTQFVPRSKHF